MTDKFVNKHKVRCPCQVVICSGVLFGAVVLGDLRVC